MSLSPFNDSSVHWYCLHTKPSKEAQAATYCGEILGLETYFPRLRQTRVIRRQRRTVTSALFPRYFFCRFDAAFSYRAVRYAPDVLNVVQAGNLPIVVDEALVQGLKSWAGEEIDVITLRPELNLRLGSEVEIISGPMQGLSGTLLDIGKEKERVTILLTILQCGAQVKVDRADVRLIA